MSDRSASHEDHGADYDDVWGLLPSADAWYSRNVAERCVHVGGVAVTLTAFMILAWRNYAHARARS